MAGSQSRQMPDPRPLIELSTAYWDAQTFLTANRIGLFPLLANGPLSAEQIAAALETAPRPTRLFLNACAGLGLLLCEDGCFQNSPVSATYLVPGSPAFMGNAFRYSDDLFATWGDLETALREDRPMLAAAEYLGDDDERTRHFVYGMHNRALGIGQALVSMVDLTGRQRLLDVGGGPGTYSMLLTARFPGLTSTVLELPGVAAIAAEILAANDAAERVAVLAGDYQETPFPKEQDVVLISGVLHRESETGCQNLIDNACAALRPGGLILLSDVFADSGGLSPRFATLFGLNMLLTARDGGVHADADVQTWMNRSGFEQTRIDAFPPPMPHRLITGVKSG
jgi:SAM-dependent methyltransferase